jgi:hypothetical protein
LKERRRGGELFGKMADAFKEERFLIVVTGKKLGSEVETRERFEGEKKEEKR